MEVVLLVGIVCLVGVALFLFGVAVVFAPDDKLPDTMETRTGPNDPNPITRPLRTDRRRMAASLFKDT